MTDFACIYPNREAVLVSYLYDEIAPAERVAFDTHVATCLACRAELADMRAVRSTIAQWAPPAPARPFSFESRAMGHEPQVSSAEPRAWWHDVPLWAQVAAAILVLGVSASVANLDIRYDRIHGLNVTTGWSKPASRTAEAQPADSAPWRAELTAMREQLQTEMRAQVATVRTASASTTGPAPVAQAAAMDAEVLKRVRLMIDDSEKKQEQQLALHLVQLQRDVNAQRTGDVRRTNQLLHDVMNTYGDELTKQQRQINYLLPAAVPASQQR